MESGIYRHRRQVLRDKLSEGAILIPGNSDSPRTYAANAYPFRQNSHMLYYTGLNLPDLHLLILPDGQEFLFGLESSPDDVVWSGPQPKLRELAEQAGLENVEPLERLSEGLRQLLGQSVTVHFPPPSRAETVLLLNNVMGLPANQIQTCASESLVSAIVSQREIKDSNEIAEIENALSVTKQAFEQAMRITAAGMREAEISASAQRIALAENREQAYLPIVSIRGEVLHNLNYGNQLKEGDLLVMDMGAESPLGYASDITRCWPVSSSFSTVQREIYAIVLQAQQTAIDTIKPGVTNLDVHLAAARKITSGLIEMGLMRGDVDEAVHAGAHALFFPHGIGHMLGLDVHDMEDLGDAVGYGTKMQRSEQFGLSYLRLAKPLQTGFVLTIEPGIYFIPALIDRWKREGRHAEFIDYPSVEKFLGFGGIRIEDDVLVTENGARVLGEGIAKSIEDVEALRS